MKILTRSIIFIGFLFLNIVFAQNETVPEDIKQKVEEKTIKAQEIIAQEEQEEKLRKEKENKARKLIELRLDLEDIEAKLTDNIWLKRYSNYKAYRAIEAELTQINLQLEKISESNILKTKELAYQLNNKVKIKENELQLISEYKNSPIGSLIKPPEITFGTDVDNPLAIFEAFSNIKILNEYKANYSKIAEELENIQPLLTKQISIVKQILELQETPDKSLEEKYEYLMQEQKDFFMVIDIVSTTNEVYNRRIEQIVLEIQRNIQKQAKEIFIVIAIILVLFLLSLALKALVKKYVTDDDRHYSTNKVINFVLVILIIIFLLFTYIDNASNLVTFLGFASAGIAIALKDWFMSMFGWIVIMTSGSINVGDRIKVTRDGTEAVGDVLDISLFKISIREDVTLTSYITNRRSGRVFFIPNNYIFTDLISNYTYDGLRTVWDGIDIYITFDSNHKKAIHLAKEIAKQYSKGYADITRKALSKMRTKYVLRSTGVDPRVFSFIEPYGIVISTWYFTNSHATLSLRSTISMEILEAFKAEDDITIAYPTQTLRVRDHSVEPENLLPGTSQSGLFDGPDGA